jgi:hypothetical protein|nr:hypothetical protein [Kofleriaceae bacterium]
MRRAPVVALLLATTSTAFASGPHRARVTADTLTALAAARINEPLRTYRDVAFATAAHAGGAAWQRFLAHAGPKWQASWDTATGVPERIWGQGIAAPGSIADAAIAEQVARAWLAAHLDLLAPGAAASDFQLVSNSYDGNIRSVGFVQTAGGREVVGGQIGFEFKHDRLFVIGSTALPGVALPAEARARPARTDLLARATAQLQQQLALPSSPVVDRGGEVVVPLVSAGGVLGYRAAAPMTIDGGADGKYDAYVDLVTGEPIAVRQTNLYATGTVTYNGIDRYPARGRVTRPAPHAYVEIDGAMATTDDAGVVTWTSDDAQTLTTALAGDYVKVVDAVGSDSSAQLALDPGGSVLWDESTDVPDDAQVNVYLDVNIVKDFVRTYVDADLPGLDKQLVANVNIAQDCNAFFDGTAINFFHATTSCQNTGLVQDVLFHEFGHDVHASEIIKGVGLFDSAMSEGVADTLAVNMTGDSGMGRGFFYTDNPLRELNPPKSEWTWPRDIGEVHQTGLIFGGTWWDIRTQLWKHLGPTDGEALLLELYVGALRRSVDIPSSLIEALATDDDDGDLSNGTPHECDIRGTYGNHGLRLESGYIDAQGATGEDLLTSQIKVRLTGVDDRCSSLRIVYVGYQARDGGSAALPSGQITATFFDADGVGSGSSSPLLDAAYGQLPLALDGVTLYQPRMIWSDGGQSTLPDNLADPSYEMYSGETVPLYCTDFESDPFAAGWTTGTGDGSPSPWAWSVPDGSGATDPPAAFSGQSALVQAPGGDYPANAISWAQTPPIDVGHYSDVRVQYRRWLAVEDSASDQATITANGSAVWMNAAAVAPQPSNLQHVDKEWRFQDVQLSTHFTGHQVTVGWQLASDPGLEFGGWALDDVCVVANPHSICGDGVQSATEQCDSGPANADAPDACRTDCTTARCGDGIVDTGEDCDAGSDNGRSACSTECRAQTIDQIGGCDAGGGGGTRGAMLLGLLVVGLLVRRRA